MLDTTALPSLRAGKNLLAFSGGVDSSALFFLLLENDIEFDLAIVDYQRRDQSKEEVAYAKRLANDHAKKCHLLETTLSEKNFEAEARASRYSFFESLITQYHYSNLITAHQLDDRLEWLLMQLSKGAGLYELLGMQAIEKREDFTLLRPLLQTPRSELLAYLQEHQITYYQDESNEDTRHRRNAFRHQIARPLMEHSVSGIKKSFDYLHEDLEGLLSKEPTVHHLKALYYFELPASRRHTVIIIDKVLKSMGHLMRQGDRAALKDAREHVVGRRYVVTLHTDYCFIAPYAQQVMDKAFKEECRLLKLPPKLRPYLAREPEVYDALKALLGQRERH